MSELNIIDSSKNLFSINKKVIVFEITNEKKNTLSNININISNSSSHYALYISHTLFSNKFNINLNLKDLLYLMKKKI